MAKLFFHFASIIPSQFIRNIHKQVSRLNRSISSWWCHEKPIFKMLINTRIGSIQREFLNPLYKLQNAIFCLSYFVFYEMFCSSALQLVAQRPDVAALFYHRQITWKRENGIFLPNWCPSTLLPRTEQNGFWPPLAGSSTLVELG